MNILFLPPLSRRHSASDGGHHFRKPLLTLLLLALILLMAGEFRANAQNICSSGGITNYEPTNIVVYTCSNSMPVSFTVTVIDANCPTNNSCYTLDNDPPSGSVFPLGTTTVTSTAIDTTFHWTNICTFTVTVIQDTNPPTIVYYPTNITLCMDSNGCAYLPDETPMVVATSGTTVSQNISPGTYLCSDTNIIFTASDPCGDATNFSALIMLVPCSNSCLQVECPSNTVVSSCTNIAVNYAPVVTDCCSNWNAICIPASGSYFSPGTITPVTCVTTDSCGNSNSCSFTVTVLPGTNCTTNCLQVICPPDITTNICTNNNVQVFYGLPQVIDPCCTNWNITFSPTNGSYFELGTSNVQCVVQDNCGNSNACSFTVTVIEDTNPPVIIFCPTNIVICSTNGCGIMPDATSEVQATEAGGSTVVITQSIAPGTEICNATDVTFTATGSCGYATNCTVPCVLETNGPVFVYCPTNIIICTNTLVTGAVIVNGDEWALSNTGFVNEADGEVYAADCAAYLTDGKGTNILISSSNFSLTQSDLYNTLINAGYGVTVSPATFNAAYLSGFNAVFLGGNNLSTSQLAALQQFICNGGGVYIAAGTGNITNSAGVRDAAAEAGQWNTLLNPFGLTLTNVYYVINETLSVSGSTLALSSSPVVAGVTNLYYFGGNDVNLFGGNSAAQVVAFTGLHGVIGVSGCTIMATNGCGIMPDVTGQVQATEADGGTVVITQSIPPGTEICGATDVTFTATDDCGHTIQTNVPCILINCSSNCLELQCWTNVVVTSCTNVPVFYAPTATDNCCSNWSVTCTPASGSYFPPGTTTPVTCVATDSCGNSNNCSFMVTVLMGTNCTTNCLQVICPPDIITNICGTNVQVFYGVPQVIDPCCTNCNISFSPTNGTHFGFGTSNVQCVVRDNCGNSNNCIFTVTVLQSTNCTNCLQIICPPDIITNICGTNVQVFYGAPQVIDPCCTNWTITFSPTNGSHFGLGTSNVECVVRDNCGNSNNCIFTVTVDRENCPPIIFLAPTNFILCAGPSGCASMPDEVHPTPNFIRLYNTGVAGTLSFSEPQALPSGTIGDPHWTLVSVPTLPPSSPQEFGTNTQLEVNATLQWVAADNLSSWIAPANDANDDAPEGNYDYQTTFILDEAANIAISGQLAADDSVVDVRLNGVSTGISITNGVASTQLNPFLIAGAGLAGTNTLDFIVQNNPLIGSNPPTDNQDTPTGLLVQFSSVTLSVSTFSLFTPAAVQATNCNGTPATGWQSIPPGTLLCSSTNITFTFTNPCGDATSYTGRVTVESCCVAPPGGMVLWLTMDESVGDTCLNSAGNNNGIRYAGNIYANNSNGPKHILGQYVNNCLGFNGSNEKVIVPNYSTIDFGTKNFSMDAWVKWSGGSGFQILLDHRQEINPSTFFGYEWFLDNGVPGIQLAAGSGGNIHNFLSNKALPTNVWIHLAVTVQRNSATGLNFYTNGVVSSTASLTSVTGNFFNSVDLWVGYSPLPGAGVPFNGDMDELELFDVTLAAYQVYDIFGAETAGKCRPTCSVPAVSTVCFNDNTVVVPVEACNSGSTPLTLSVSFNGLTSAQAGGAPAVNGPPSSSFSGYPTTIILPPHTCTNFNVTIKLPANLTLSAVAYYQMTIMDAAGQRFDSIGELKRTASIWCFIWNNPTTNVLNWNQTTNFTFAVNNPSNAVVTLNSEVITMDGNLQPETNVVSLNNQAPGIPVTNQILISPFGSQPVSVNVNYLDAQPWTPYCLVLFLNIGTNGTMVPVASSAFAEIIPATTGPVVSASTTNGQLVVSWDIVNTGWTLLSTANLNGTNWVPVNLPVLPLPDGSQGVTLLPANTLQFYRLSGPGSP